MVHVSWLSFCKSERASSCFTAAARFRSCARAVSARICPRERRRRSKHRRRRLRRPKVSPLVRDRGASDASTRRAMKASTSCRAKRRLLSDSKRSCACARTEGSRRETSTLRGAFVSALCAHFRTRERALGGVHALATMAAGSASAAACRWRATPPSRRVSRLATRCGDDASDVRATGDRAFLCPRVRHPRAAGGGRRPNPAHPLPTRRPGTGSTTWRRRACDTRAAWRVLRVRAAPAGAATREDLERYTRRPRTRASAGHRGPHVRRDRRRLRRW